MHLVLFGCGRRRGAAAFLDLSDVCAVVVAVVLDVD